MKRRAMLAAPFAAALGPATAQSRTSLVEAAGRGDLAQVEALLRAGADIEQRDAGARTAVLAATDGNHVDVVRALIARGANVNAQDNQRDSAFLLAGARGYTDVVRATLSAGADLKSTNRYGGTALIPACHHGHVETVRLLLTTAFRQIYSARGACGECWRLDARHVVRRAMCHCETGVVSCPREPERLPRC
jgi:uncharacterized protein